MQRVNNFLRSKAAGVAFLFLIVAAIPLTVFVSQQTQETRQRASQVCGNVAADLMLVIDKSGSMQGTAIASAKSAAKSFVDIIAADTNNRLGLVSYSSSGSLDKALSNDFSGVKSKIDNIGANGSTCTQCGIKKANEEITLHKRNGFKNVVVLLTDGKANQIQGHNQTTDTAAAEAAALAEVQSGKTVNDTVYFTIGLGSDLNTAFLQQIANTTGGKYYAAPLASDLPAIYQQISQIVGKGSISGSLFNDINGNGTQDTGEANLTGWQIDLTSSSTHQVTTFTTDATGAFSFVGICDDQYVMTVKTQTGWSVTTPQGGSYTILITNGDSQTDKKFGVNNTPPTPTPTMTPIPSNTPIPTMTPLPPTATPTTGITLTPTIQATGSVQFSFLVSLQPHQSLANKNPIHPVRQATVKVYQSGTQTLVGQSPFTLSYNNTNYLFSGAAGLDSVPPGTYDVRIEVGQNLRKLFPNQTLVAGNNVVPQTTLIVGDVNNDNILDILDFQTITHVCFGTRANLSDTCTAADLDDNGTVDIIDANYLFRNFAIRSGE